MNSKSRTSPFHGLSSILRIAVVFVLLPTIGLAGSADGNRSESSRPNLNGLWVGTGYTCNGLQPPEEVRIEERGETVVAIKTAGDACIHTGEITWRGSPKQNSFPIKFNVTPGGASRHFIDGTARIVHEDMMIVSTASFSVTFWRKGTLPITRVSFLRQAERGFERVTDHLAHGDSFKLEVEIAPAGGLAPKELQVRLNRSDRKSKVIMVTQTAANLYHSELLRVEKARP